MRIFKAAPFAELAHFYINGFPLCTHYLCFLTILQSISFYSYKHRYEPL